jgi:hypothetical protein
VHDVGRLDETVRANGFEPVSRRRLWMWLVAVYARSSG